MTGSKLYGHQSLQGLWCATGLSAFIYLAHFEIDAPLLHTLLGLAGYYGLLHLDKRALAYAGFFVGVFWFWWVALSMRYYGLSLYMPLVIVGVGLVYALVFYAFGWLPRWWRIVGFFALGIVHPFGFHYLDLEAVLVYSHIPTQGMMVFFVLVALYRGLPTKQPLSFRWFYVLVLVGLFATYGAYLKATTPQALPPQDQIELTHTAIPQDQKWNPRYLPSHVAFNEDRIRAAIAQGKSAIVFPENAFDTLLADRQALMQRLKTLSHQITIIAGSVHRKDGANHPATFVFDQGEVKIHYKYILVPFGEQIPAPDWLRDKINTWFFGGASDFKPADGISTFAINGTTFNNAICYESTSEALYANSPSSMIAISNNAWFYPSIQPTLQHILLQLRANQYRTTIYHATNLGKTALITPR